LSINAWLNFNTGSSHVSSMNCGLPGLHVGKELVAGGTEADAVVAFGWACAACADTAPSRITATESAHTGRHRFRTVTRFTIILPSMTTTPAAAFRCFVLGLFAYPHTQALLLGGWV
jgi:hypothetical protein